MPLTLDPDLTGSGGVWQPRLVGDKFAGMGACGRSFGRGVFRFHDADSGPVAQELLSIGFPELADHAEVFAFDWLGRQFAMTDEQGSDTGQPEAVLLDPASRTCEGLIEPAKFIQAFQTSIMLDVLQVELFSQWQSAADSQGLEFDRCVGLKAPVFLGGTVSIDNLQESDIDVYWSLCNQVWLKVKDLPDGSRVGSIGIGPER